MIDFILRNLIELASLPGSVPKLRSFILDQAVRGHPTADWRATHPDTEPASALIDRIKQEKQAMVRSGKIKKQKELPPVEAEDVPFAVPQSWEWVRLGNLGIVYTGSTPGVRSREQEGQPFPFAGPGDINEGQIVPSRSIPESAIKESTITKTGDVLCVCIGGSIGKTAMTFDEIAINQQINGLSTFDQATSRWAHRIIQSEFVQTQIVSKASGSATPIITLSKWSAVVVPLSSHHEQTEIVHRVEELMALCDQLASTHRTRAAHAEELLTTALGTAS